MLLLLAVLLISIVGLIPSQSNDALGVELLVLALVFGGVIARLERRSLPKTPQPPSQVLMRIFLIVAATLPMIAGGVSLLAESGGGLYWIAAGIVFATAGGVANAWVLMVEILR